MESCLLITRNAKPKERKGKVLFIDARKELKREKTISFLLPEHISKIYKTYCNFENIKGFSHVADINEILEKDSSLNVPLYVKNISSEIFLDPSEAYKQWESSNNELNDSITKLFNNH